MRELIEPADHPARLKAVQATRSSFPERFRREEDARDYLRSVILPPSLRWAYVLNGKSASSTLLRFLFRVEFGSELTVAFDSNWDINPAALVHQLYDRNVFHRAVWIPLSAGELLERPDLLRIALVRHPLARAISAFRYFCRSNELRHGFFLEDRLRINAMTGFDWHRMPYTEAGMLSFLDYIEADQSRFGSARVNHHWRLQADNVYPEIFRPTHLGKVETLDSFLRELWERLVPAGEALPEGLVSENRQPANPTGVLDTQAVRRRVETIYARDFEAFGYG
jgi:hypothetical protein